MKLTVLAILILLTGLFTMFSILRTPSFQMLVGRLAADLISKKFNTTIYIDKLRISELLSVKISGLKIFDHQDQLLLTLEELNINLDKISLKDHLIKVDRLALANGGFHLNFYSADSLLNLNYFINKLMPMSSDTSGESIAWTIYCNNLTLDDMSFSFKDDRREHSPGQIDFDDLMLTAIYLNLTQISIIGDSITASFQHFSFDEKSGFSLHGFYGDSRVSSSGIRVENLKVVTNQSSLEMDLEFLYDDYSHLGYFLDSVYIRADMSSSLITLSDVGYFAPIMFKMGDPVMFSGEVDGYVSDFSARSFAFKLGDFTEFNGDISMKGLPDFSSTYVSLDIEKLTTTPDDLSRFHLPLEKSNLDLPGQLMMLGLTTVVGSYEGMMDDFNTSFYIDSELGRLQVEGSLSGKNPDGISVYAGDIKASQLDLGTIMEVEDLGTLDLEIEFEGKGTNLDDLDLLLNGWLENLYYKNYQYEKIILGGQVKSKSFNGRLMTMDPSLTFSFDGMVDFNPETPKLDFTLDLLTAKFSDLNLSDKSRDMDLKGKIRGDFTGVDIESFKGTVEIDSLTYTENGSVYLMKRLSLSRFRSIGNNDSISLRSDIADAEFFGNFSVLEIAGQITEFITGRGDDSEGPRHEDENVQRIDFDITLKDISPVTEIFMPSFHISPGAAIKGRFDNQGEKLEFDAAANLISFSGIKAADVRFLGRTKGEEFYLDVSASQVIISENADTTEIGLQNFSIEAFTSEDSVIYSVLWDNFDPVLPNKALINGFLRITGANSFETGITRAEANFNGDLWHVEGQNILKIDSGSYIISNLNIIKDTESFSVDGTVTRDPRDTLNLTFENWSLVNFNPLLRNKSIELGGTVDGRIGLTRNESAPNMFAGIIINDFSFNQVYFGEADINTTWLDADSALSISMDIFSKGEIDDRYKILNINGLYSPFSKVQNFNFYVSSKNLDVSVLEPMVTSFSSRFGGFATGNLTVSGTMEKPVLEGSMKLQRAELLVDYLNVLYSFSNEIIFKENFIGLDQVSVYDPYTNQAMLRGGISHTYFKNMQLDLIIEPENFLGFNLNRYQNNVFYGLAYATGTVRLSGPFDNISINVDVRTDKGTNVFIPIQYSVDVSQGDFIIFSTQADSLPHDSAREVKVVGIGLDIGMNITRDADIEIILPGNIGFIRAKGDGKLRLGVDPNGYLNMNGSYKIQTGLFVFSLEQLVSRRFDILEGSTISWTGDINDAEVNIVARYRLRTSLDGLGISLIDPDAASQKIIVFTDIRLTGNLFNPDLSFGVSFPNLQEQTKQAVYAVLDTTDLGLMNQQAISLLVLGSFSSTGTGGSNPVNAAAIVSSTLSNMLSQISNDFNIGINYVPGDHVTDEQLEVALSTQLLDDRLIIDGNIDVTGSSTSSQKTSSIVGDFNIEYKLTSDGRFRVKAFNRSNDLSLYNDYSAYTQGVGVFYRKEFDNIREFFSRRRKVRLPDTENKDMDDAAGNGTGR